MRYLAWIYSCWLLTIVHRISKFHPFLLPLCMYVCMYLYITYLVGVHIWRTTWVRSLLLPFGSQGSNSCPEAGHWAPLSGEPFSWKFSSFVDIFTSKLVGWGLPCSSVMPAPGGSVNLEVQLTDLTEICQIALRSFPISLFKTKPSSSLFFGAWNSLRHSQPSYLCYGPNLKYLLQVHVLNAQSQIGGPIPKTIEPFKSETRWWKKITRNSFSLLSLFPVFQDVNRHQPQAPSALPSHHDRLKSLWNREPSQKKFPFPASVRDLLTE